MEELGVSAFFGFSDDESLAGGESLVGDESFAGDDSSLPAFLAFPDGELLDLLSFL